ncbi:DUF559 domain-containing protein [Krasilnikovia cinnamomea]|uniref:DUF559 domain-containing protein n=1 Tax=Krasilnikovia cinnamomea TaxID=349313 RepID=UPI001F5EB462|nr:DUF559 domain-containing protein [Krasilnikovia cinnamomea]
MDVLLDHQSGVITMAQALDYLSEKAVRHRLATGRWQRLHRSVFLTHNGPVGVAQRRWAAVLSVGQCAVLAGLTAVDLRGYSTAAIHVLVPPAVRGRSVPRGVVVHRSAALDERDVLTIGGPPRTRAARSLVDAAQWAPTVAETQAIVAAGFQQRLVRAADVRAVLERLPRARRRRIIGRAVDDATGGAHSLAELDFVALCRRHRLPEPKLQVVRRDAAGRRRYLDALFEEWQVHVEVDGGHHLEVRQAWADMSRQNALWIAGDRILRFPAWAIRHDSATVVAQLRAALHAAGWR